jgi:hypothetical protein
MRTIGSVPTGGGSSEPSVTTTYLDNLHETLNAGWTDPLTSYKYVAYPDYGLGGFMYLAAQYRSAIENSIATVTVALYNTPNVAVLAVTDLAIVIEKLIVNYKQAALYDY